MFFLDIVIVIKCFICIGELEIGGSLVVLFVFVVEIRYVYLYFGVKCSKNGGNMLMYS